MSCSCQLEQESNEWMDGFLFVANRPILDLLNTRPVLADGPDGAAAGCSRAGTMVDRFRDRDFGQEIRLLYGRWRNSPEAAVFLKQLIAFRERLRDAVLRIESGNLAE